MKEKITLLVSTYNWPEALDLCFQSIYNQSVFPHEIIVADDGSTTSTQILIQTKQRNNTIPIRHVWQKDQGFRLSQIRNKALSLAQGNYIIQIDGDVILHPEFIADHIRMMKKETFVIGSRVHLYQPFSETILKSGKLPKLQELRKNGKDKLNQIRLLSLARFFRYRYKVKGRHRFTAKGCNMAYWKEQILAVNGYNEEITGWGSEDEELVVRLIKSGHKKQFMKMAGIVFHIYHPIASRSKKEENESILASAIANHSNVCRLGINQYL